MQLHRVGECISWFQLLGIILSLLFLGQSMLNSFYAFNELQTQKFLAMH